MGQRPQFLRPQSSQVSNPNFTHFEIDHALYDTLRIEISIPSLSRDGEKRQKFGPNPISIKISSIKKEWHFYDIDVRGELWETEPRRNKSVSNLDQ
jgi:hypothetical protein